MDVRLPDGHIIRNVPDGTSKADLTAKLRSNGYDVSNLGGAGASGAGASGAGASALEIPTTYNGERAPRDEYFRIIPPGSTTSREPEPEELRTRPRSLGGATGSWAPESRGGATGSWHEPEPEELGTRSMEPEPEEVRMSLGSALLSGAANTPKDFVEAVSGIANAVIHLDETANGLARVAMGAGMNMLNLDAKQVAENLNKLSSTKKAPIDPEKLEEMKNLAGAIGSHYKKLFSDGEYLKNEFANRPVQTLMDVAIIFDLATGGLRSAARVSTMGARFGGKVGAKVGAKVGGRIGAKVAGEVGGEFGAMVGGQVGVKVGVGFKGAANALNKGAKFSEGVANKLDVSRPLLRLTTKAGFGTTKAVANWVRKLTNPQHEFITNITEKRMGNMQNIIRILENPPTESIPGYPATFVEQIGDKATPTIAASERALIKQYGSTLNADRIEKVNAAVDKHLTRVAKTDTELRAAKDLRDANKKKLYGEADKQVAEMDKTFNELSNRPSMRDAIKAAKRLLAEKGKELYVTQPIESLGRAGSISGEGVGAIKRALGDLINKTVPRKGLGSAEAGAIMSTKADFLKWAEADSKIPGYAKARKQFQKDSQVIDRMVVGRALKSKLFQSKTALEELRGNAFLSALEEELKTIKRSTGDTRYKSLSDLFTPEDLQVIREVREAIQRGEKVEDLVGLGSSAGVHLNNISHKLNFLNQYMAVFNWATSMFTSILTPKAALKLAGEMIDPNSGELLARFKKSARINTRWGQAESVIKNLGSRAQHYGLTTSLKGTIMVNKLSNEAEAQEWRNKLLPNDGY